MSIAASGLLAGVLLVDRTTAGALGQPVDVSVATEALRSSAVAGQSLRTKANNTVAGQMLFLGKGNRNEFGTVQVRATVTNGQLTDVVAVQTPREERKSVRINAAAIPKLRRSALAIQSALVDNVSGATYTTNSYRASLQSAIDQARSTAAITVS